jgi:hypothetical protein
MAIAASKLGRIVREHWHSDDEIVRRLRESGLVREDVSDDALRATFKQAREEHAALPPDEREYNSPNERVRVFLAPFLSDKGRAWAAPGESFKLPDDDGPARSRVQTQAAAVEHQCWWTRRGETELADHGGSVRGAGVPVRVLRVAATLLGAALSVNPSKSDQYGEEVVLHPVAAGATHDGCFFRLEPTSIELKRALLEAVLSLHSHYYLNRHVNWSQVQTGLLEQWTTGVALRIRSFPRSGEITVRRYEAGAGLLVRLFAQSSRINCSGGRATII